MVFWTALDPLSLSHLLPDARIRQRVEEIGQEVHGHIRQANHKNAALDQVVVAAADGADGQAADARQEKIVSVTIAPARSAPN